MEHKENLDFINKVFGDNELDQVVKEHATENNENAEEVVLDLMLLYMEKFIDPLILKDLDGTLTKKETNHLNKLMQLEIIRERYDSFKIAAEIVDLHRNIRRKRIRIVIIAIVIVTGILSIVYYFT